MDMASLPRALSILAAVLFLNVGCCSAQALCTCTYSLAYLNTVQSNEAGPIGALGIFRLPTNYTNAYINLCAPATGYCVGAVRACLQALTCQTSSCATVHLLYRDTSTPPHLRLVSGLPARSAGAHLYLDLPRQYLHIIWRCALVP
jgi:hypothetical protein